MRALAGDEGGRWRYNGGADIVRCAAPEAVWCGDAGLHLHNVSLMARAGEMLAVVSD
jgi:hypothetical protein